LFPTEWDVARSERRAADWTTPDRDRMVARMIRELSELPALLGRNRRLLGLDVGEKTIGLAVSDPGLVVASPIGTVRRSKIAEDCRALAKAVRDYDAGAFVVGLPLNMNGTEGPRVESVRQFAQNVLERANLIGIQPEIAFWDERLSTVAVERFMIGEADMTRKRRDEVVDKMAAAYILQGALDALSYARRRAAEEADEGTDES
jgi:putative holliday junction resolvase